MPGGDQDCFEPFLRWCNPYMCRVAPPGSRCIFRPGLFCTTFKKPFPFNMFKTGWELWHHVEMVAHVKEVGNCPHQNLRPMPGRGKPRYG